MHSHSLIVQRSVHTVLPRQSATPRLWKASHLNHAMLRLGLRMETYSWQSSRDLSSAVPARFPVASCWQRNITVCRKKRHTMWTVEVTHRQLLLSHYKVASLKKPWHALRAFSNDNDRGGRTNGDEDGWDSSLEIEVPADQRPVNELAALKEGVLYSWAEKSPIQFTARLGGLWLFFFLLLGGPIAAGSFEPSREPLKFLLAGGAGALFAVAVLVLRMYLGWSYVGDRLLSAVVPYEETGWYDGQLWVKPPEILARDRLLGAYQVKPVMNRLKQTLIGAGALLATATAVLVVLLPTQEGPDAVRIAPPRHGSEVHAAEGKVGFRKRDLLNPPMAVLDDDELAAAAAAAANGRPVYCSDRYYRALAGGQYCKWED